MTFILIIILIFLLARIWNYIAPYLIRRYVRRTFGFDPQSGQQRRRQQSTQPQQPAKQKKKIDPNIGEYVEFTETTESTTRQTADGTETTVKTEQQITDVQWEDIP